jgi:hypothetical protein
MPTSVDIAAQLAAQLDAVIRASRAHLALPLELEHQLFSFLVPNSYAV